MLVVPAHQLRGYLQGTGCGIRFIHRLLDSPARGALADFNRHPELWQWYKHRLAQIRLLLHLDQELAYDIAAKKLIIRGPASRQAMLRVDDLHAIAQRPQHPCRAEYIAVIRSCSSRRGPALLPRRPHNRRSPWGMWSTSRPRKNIGMAPPRTPTFPILL